MKIGSLFSGIGALDLGVLSVFPDAEHSWFAEQGQFCRTILAKHWPNIPCYKDVRDIDDRADRPTIICGGFPCQPVSFAGKRLAQKDERWLWPEFARIIGCLRPDIVFIENVPGLRSAGLRDVLADLARLGFNAEWDHFTASEVGAPHIRKRLFILAYADSVKLRDEYWRRARPCRLGPSEPTDASKASDVADSDSISSNTRRGDEGSARSASLADLKRRIDPRDAPNPYSERQLQPERLLSNQWGWSGDGDRWKIEPPVPGVDDGAPDRLDRERALGNAVVYQCAALALRTLIERAINA